MHALWIRVVCGPKEICMCSISPAFGLEMIVPQSEAGADLDI